MEIRHDSANPSGPLGMRFLEVNLIGMACGIWQWQVRDNQKVISYGYATAREVARFGGHRDLFFLLSLGRLA